MRKKIAICIFSLVILAMAGCKKFLDVNKNPNDPTDVQEALILAPVEQVISDNIYAGGLSINAQIFLQTMTANQPNPGVWNYRMYNADTNGDWFTFYVTCLNNLKALQQKADANQNWNYAAIARILTAYMLATATDYWGDIPYSKALDKNNFFSPYDTQEDIYKTLQSLLTESIVNIDKQANKKPGSDDFFYGGDMSKWRKLALSLKARYFMHLTKAPGYNALTQSDSALTALTSGLIDNTDDLKFSYQGNAGTEGSLYLIFSPVSTYVLNSTLIDTLKARNDPRLSYIAKPSALTGNYTGRRIGGEAIDIATYSYPNVFYASPSSPNYLFTYLETQFIKAEALYLTKGFAAASPVYLSAINKSMSKLGIDTTSTAAKTYVASRQLTDANALRFIIEEKAIANLFNFESYTDWRRTGYPLLTPVDGALSAIPRRFLYPQSEKEANPQPQQSAKLTDRLWWDTQ